MSQCHQQVAAALTALFLGVAPLAAQAPMTLAQAIARAQEQGHQAAAARDALEAARHRNNAFSGSLLPQLSLRGTLPEYNRSIVPVLQPDGSTVFRSQQQTSTDLSMTLSQQLPYTGGSIFVSSSLARYAVSGTRDFASWSSTPVTVGVRQDIFRPNMAKWDQREQHAQIQFEERVYAESMEQIAIQTTQAFFDLYSARVGLDNAVKNAAVNDTLYTLNKGRFEIGRIGENDLLQSELALLRARSSVQDAQLEFDRAAAALRLNLNLPAGTPLEIDVPRDVPEVNPDTAQAVAAALRNRSTVSQVALNDVLARRSISLAQVNSGIGATVQASFGYNATAPEARLAYQNLLDSRQFALTLEVPLWQWGSNSENVAAAKADRERMISLSQATLEQLAHDAHFAALELAQAYRNVALSAKVDTVAGRRFDVAYNRYVIGRITIDNLYIAQSEKDQAVSQFVLALRNYWLAYYRLRLATAYDFETGRPIGVIGSGN
ncbi:MAG: TolC family protein [Gemmatimonadota bacterium]